MRTVNPSLVSAMNFAVLLGVLSLNVAATAVPPPEHTSTTAYITGNQVTANPWLCLSSTTCKLVGDGPETQYGDYMTLGTKDRIKVTCKYRAPDYFKPFKIDSKYVASFHTCYCQ
jgi:hypothetical protein